MSKLYYLYDGVRLTPYDNLYDLCISNFKIKINRLGIISVKIKPYYNTFVSTMSYDMNEYTKDEAIRDFCNMTFPKHIPNYGYKIIKGKEL